MNLRPDIPPPATKSVLAGPLGGRDRRAGDRWTAHGGCVKRLASSLRPPPRPSGRRRGARRAPHQHPTLPAVRRAAPPRQRPPVPIRLPVTGLQLARPWAPQGHDPGRGYGHGRHEGQRLGPGYRRSRRPLTRLADAHAQALAAADRDGVCSCKGIYSVSIASDTSDMYATPDCVVAPPVPGTNTGCHRIGPGARPPAPRWPAPGPRPKHAYVSADGRDTGSSPTSTPRPKPARQPTRPSRDTAAASLRMPLP